MSALKVIPYITTAACKIIFIGVSRESVSRIHIVSLSAASATDDTNRVHRTSPS